MDRLAALGIGSTNCRSVVATADGEFLTPVSVEPTEPRELASQVVRTVGRLAETAGPLDAVAVSVAGLVDGATGRVRAFDTPDGGTVERIDLGTAVDRAHGLNLHVENDCNAAALGECHYGAGGDYRSVTHLTFGTGIGGGVVDHGRLVRGEFGQAGEVGLLPICPDGDRASTGVVGAWEAYCSGRGIAGFAADRLRATDRESVLDPDDLDAAAVFDAAAAGDAVARDCLDRVDRYNAAGIGAVCNAVNPGLVTVGGGVALNNPDRLLDGVDRHLEEFLFVDRPELRVTPLGDDIELYGALGAYLNAIGADGPVVGNGGE